MEMWVLEQENGIQRALDKSSHLVLKPQREGGGNNVYKSHIPKFLSTLPESEREAWIAMELINVPHGVQNWLVRSGHEESVIKSNVISELGTFGWVLFGWQGKEGSNRTLRLTEGSDGYLLRTKAEESDEGGVAAGFSVLDSVVLID
jgi:glutathione synthase